jgi:putative ABC transport system substrate-binding protein
MDRQIDRRDLIIALGACAFVAPMATQARQPIKLRRIGVLAGGSPESTGFVFDPFMQRLSELGYVDGKDISYEFRWASGKIERLPELAQELVALHPDVIFTAAQNTAEAAHKATRSIPIVSIGVGDPVEHGLAKSLARPGGNVTGLSNLYEDAAPKRLELLRAVVLKLDRVATLLHPAEPIVEGMKRLRTVAQPLGLDILEVQVSTPADIDGAFAGMATEHVGAVMPGGYMWGFLHRRVVADAALKYRMPTMFGGRDPVEAGGLMSYGINLVDAFQRAAIYVDKIFRGAKPADLPFEQATRLEFVINLKTAKELGLTIPRSVLLRADDLIQ